MNSQRTAKPKHVNANNERYLKKVCKKMQTLSDKQLQTFK
mgnify:CR=1